MLLLVLDDLFDSFSDRPPRNVLVVAAHEADLAEMLEALGSLGLVTISLERIAFEVDGYWRHA